MDFSYSPSRDKKKGFSKINKRISLFQEQQLSGGKKIATFDEC
jgi:hypothetical protein